jgi:adenosylcobinamide kinase/adenosylcobinamide-phosphate guanylyltransferase
MLILVTGGARSGKSTFAEYLASERGEKVLYLATAIPVDDEMKARIGAHRAARPDQWKTIERYKGFEELAYDPDFLEAETLLLDCVTIMISNIILDSALDFDECGTEELDALEDEVAREVEELIDLAEEYGKVLIAVTNELGMGLVPTYRLGRIFRDMAGRMNQYLAQRAGHVYFLVSGLPLQLK